VQIPSPASLSRKGGERIQKDKIDVLYVTRPQVEKWSDEELERFPNLEAAKRELAMRRRRNDRGISGISTARL